MAMERERLTREAAEQEQLDDAEAALRSARDYAQDLANLGRLKLDKAVAKGPSGAADLLRYYDRLSAADQWTALLHTQVQRLRQEAGLALLSDSLPVTPDWPDLDPFTPGPKTSAYLFLRCALTARDLHGAAQYLGELAGLLPDRPYHGDENQPDGASGQCD
jgi:hypothetical protein